MMMKNTVAVGADGSDGDDAYYSGGGGGGACSEGSHDVAVKEGGDDGSSGRW